MYVSICMEHGDDMVLQVITNHKYICVKTPPHVCACRVHRNQNALIPASARNRLGYGPPYKWCVGTGSRSRWIAWQILLLSVDKYACMHICVASAPHCISPVLAYIKQSRRKIRAWENNDTWLISCPWMKWPAGRAAGKTKLDCQRNIYSTIVVYL